MYTLTIETNPEGVRVFSVDLESSNTSLVFSSLAKASCFSGHSIVWMRTGVGLVRGNKNYRNAGPLEVKVPVMLSSCVCGSSGAESIVYHLIEGMRIKLSTSDGKDFAVRLVKSSKTDHSSPADDVSVSEHVDDNSTFIVPSARKLGIESVSKLFS